MKSPLLITMAGPRQKVDFARVSNFEAGLAFLGVLGRMRPGLTFGSLAAEMDGISSGRMSGWLTDMTRAVGNLKDGIGDVLKDTTSLVGGSAGSAVRLITDENVIDGASRLGTAYATNGGSEGVKSLLGGGGGSVQSVIDFISSLGSSAKNQALQSESVGGQLPSWAIPVGLGGVAFLLLARR